MRKINMYRNVITGQANPAPTAYGNTVGAGSARPMMHWVMAMLVLFLAACSNELDEPMQPAHNGTLQFVVSDFPAFGENPETRTSQIGIPDAGKTAWEAGDEIIVELYSSKYKSQCATLIYDGSQWNLNGSLSYLENEMPTVYALYAPCYEVAEVGLRQFRDSMLHGMTEYLVPSDCQVENNSTISISFDGVTRDYSRLRIVGLAGQTYTVTTTGFTPAAATSEATEPYTLTADDKGNAYLYGTFAKDATVTVKQGEIEVATHTFNVATKAGGSYALYAGEKEVVDLSTLTGTYTITEDGYYEFTGTGSYGIKVESGNPRIVLKNASITVGEGSAIDVASGSNATIFVLGDNTIGTTKTEYSDVPCGGIFVAEGGTVNITSNGTDNILRARGTSAAAIGGKYDENNNESYNAGNISISNVTVYAYTNDYYAAAIGAAGEGACGTINITNAVVYAYGAGDEYDSAPGIGSALSITACAETSPVVIISGSEIHTFRYNQYSDYIGFWGLWKVTLSLQAKFTVATVAR